VARFRAAEAKATAGAVGETTTVDKRTATTANSVANPKTTTTNRATTGADLEALITRASAVVLLEAGLNSRISPKALEVAPVQALEVVPVQALEVVQVQALEVAQTLAAVLVLAPEDSEARAVATTRTTRTTRTTTTTILEVLAVVPVVVLVAVLPEAALAEVNSKIISRAVSGRVPLGAANSSRSTTIIHQDLQVDPLDSGEMPGALTATIIIATSITTPETHEFASTSCRAGVTRVIAVTSPMTRQTNQNLV